MLRVKVIGNCVYLLQEERFLYPIYPLLAYIAGNTLDHILHAISVLFSTNQSVSDKGGKGKSSAKTAAAAGKTKVAAWVGNLKTGLLLACMVGSLTLFAARIASNSFNYSGKLAWFADSHLLRVDYRQASHGDTLLFNCSAL